MASEIHQLFHVNSLPTFLWKLCATKPEFNDVCVLFKHSNFCSRMLEMHSEKPSFQNFLRGHETNRTPLVTHTFSAHKSCLWHEFFPSLPTQKFLPPTVPLKSKLTLEARNSRLDPHLSKLECFEFRYARIESRDARIKSRVSMIEDRGSKKLGFPKERCCTVT